MESLQKISVISKIKLNPAINTFLLFILLLLGTNNVGATDNLGSEETLISIKIAEFVALDHAKQFYPEMGEFNVYNVETYYDLGGKPAIYAVVLTTLDEFTTPSLEELKTNIKKAYSSINSLKQSISEIESESISGKAKSKRIVEKREKIRKAQALMTGRDSFVTVICGATESRVPVLKLFKGLPEHLTQPPGLLEKQNVKDAVSGNIVMRIFYLGMFDLAFEFGTPEEAQHLKTSVKMGEISPTTRLIHSRLGKIAELSELQALIKERIEDAKQKDISEKSSRLKTIQKKWTRVKTRYKQYLREKSSYGGEEGVR